MQRERISGTGQPEQTRFDIFKCDCGHEFVRPQERPNVLPCAKCGGRKWSVTRLLAGEARIVMATV